MAESEVSDADQARKMQAMQQIVVEEVKTVDEAQKMLVELREAKLQKTTGLDQLHLDTIPTAMVPEEFMCPLSKKIMKDPVIVATGVTYDRPSIQEWLNSAKRTCPQTQQVLSHTVLVPNSLIRDMIEDWCKNLGIN